MEHHGKNPEQSIIAVIPARYSSTRLPGKMLREIGGKPLILHTLDRARSAKTVDRVIVATDDERISNVVSQAGGEAVMTSPDHRSGSDRIAEVAKELPEGSIIVNVQGDEPVIRPETIDVAVQALIDDPRADMSTTCEPITDLWGELLNGNVVKVVIGEYGYAVYFSRSPMPWPREASLRHGGDPNHAITEEPELLREHYHKHTGLYVYRREFLLQFASWPQTRLEKWEMLEQLRALEHGAKIRVVDAVGTSIGVDTEEDLKRVRELLERVSVPPAVAGG
ncbi:MAG: 3-deoxy-manno-octulosonate cytidylyltransferase [Acidobacteria bacterium]|nr:3-deoxy-manno-octulosonate cytidylyltransferase [Acidobacteriota bacterium]